jgi:hypothetical protein
MAFLTASGFDAGGSINSIGIEKIWIHFPESPMVKLVIDAESGNNHQKKPPQSPSGERPGCNRRDVDFQRVATRRKKSKKRLSLRTGNLSAKLSVAVLKNPRKSWESSKKSPDSRFLRKRLKPA